MYALSDVLYAFLTTEPEAAAALTDIVSLLLLSDDLAVSFAAKQGLIRVLRPKQRRRRVFIPSPPRCSTPGGCRRPNLCREGGRETIPSPPRFSTPGGCAAGPACLRGPRELTSWP